MGIGLSWLEGLCWQLAQGNCLFAYIHPSQVTVEGIWNTKSRGHAWGPLTYNLKHKKGAYCETETERYSHTRQEAWHSLCGLFLRMLHTQGSLYVDWEGLKDCHVGLLFPNTLRVHFPSTFLLRYKEDCQLNKIAYVWIRIWHFLSVWYDKLTKLYTSVSSFLKRG